MSQAFCEGMNSVLNAFAYTPAFYAVVHGLDAIWDGGLSALWAAAAGR